jgi:succinyl-diaminopimelate desuccinylase
MQEQNFEKYIDDHRDALVDFFRELLRFPSELAEPLPDKPFGKPIDDCYRYLLAKAEDGGFTTFDADGFGGHIEWSYVENNNSTNGACNNPTKTFATALHLDVVPAGEGWTYDPYAAHVDGNIIYGRGASDNKDSVAAVYMALKALKDTGFKPKKNLRLIIGLDEETGWTGMQPYLKKAGKPDFGFVPDAHFPVINGEMGIIEFTLVKKIADTDSGAENKLLSLSGGTAANVVPDIARIEIQNAKTGGIVEFTAKGEAAHASKPWLGINAISVLMDALASHHNLGADARAFIDFYNKHIGFNLGGDNLGIGFEDEPSGHLIFNAGVINFTRQEIRLTVNLRYPVTLKEEDIYKALEPVCAATDIEVERGLHLAPIYYAPDTPLVQKLLGVYRNYIPGDDLAPMVIGGGTYARAIPNAVAFGPKMPGKPSYEHRIDERKDIDELVLITKIYASAIKALTETEE